MITETIKDYENEKELSIHFNEKNILCLTLENFNEDDYWSFQFIHLEKEDAQWIINQLQTAIKQL